MLTANETSLFWDVFAWENRDRRLDDFPLMQSPIGPIGQREIQATTVPGVTIDFTFVMTVN